MHFGIMETLVFLLLFQSGETFTLVNEKVLFIVCTPWSEINGIKVIRRVIDGRTWKKI